MYYPPLIPIPPTLGIPIPLILVAPVLDYPAPSINLSSLVNPVSPEHGTPSRLLVKAPLFPPDVGIYCPIAYFVFPLPFTDQNWIGKIQMSD